MSFFTKPFKRAKGPMLKPGAKPQFVAILAVVLIIGGAGGYFVGHSLAATSGCINGVYGYGHDTSGYCVKQIQKMVNGLHATAKFYNQFQKSERSPGSDPFGASFLSPIDGQFGPATNLGVREAQRSVGFSGSSVDGVVGPNTWRDFCAYTTFSPNIYSFDPVHVQQARDAHKAVC